MWEPQRLRSRNPGISDAKLDTAVLETPRLRNKNIGNSTPTHSNGAVDANVWKRENQGNISNRVLDSTNPAAAVDCSAWEPQRLRSKNAGISGPAKSDVRVDATTWECQGIKRMGSNSGAPKREANPCVTQGECTKNIKMDPAWQRNLTNVRVHIRDLGMKVGTVPRDLKKEPGKVVGKGARIKGNKPAYCPAIFPLLYSAEHRFRVIDVGGYGRTSDGGILANSTFGQALRAGTLHLPPDQPLPGGEHRGAQPHVFVADEAFPLRRELMRPFPGRLLPLEKKIFNYRLSRARMIVEGAFGILSSQWRLYRRAMELRPEIAEKCVKATCVLHNFLRCVDERGAPAVVEPLQGLGRMAANNSSREAVLVREKFMTHFSTEGAVSWQPKE
uniref:DDE Tnp4 domain-containing protein n=1 Tax=Pundamilia nyererei TaxID=303518 RepID=A0A3B4HA67_9CICH